MKNISSRDLTNLSSYLDGQLTPGEMTRLEKRLKAEPGLAATLHELREVRAILRNSPRRRAPRRFTLSAQMVGVRPPLPRLVPAFSWASAAAALFFVLTLGSNMIGRLSFGTADMTAETAPMLASDPAEAPGIGGGVGPDEQFTSETVVDSTEGYLESTPDAMMMTAPQEPAAEPENRAIPPEESQVKIPPSINPWLVIWPALALVLIAIALLVRWLNLRDFRRRNKIQ